MLVTLTGIITLVRPVQRWKRPSIIQSAPSEIVTFVSPVQSLKADSCAYVAAGITTLVSPVQPSNVQALIVSTLSGIVMLVSAIHPENALYPMYIKPSGNVTPFKVFLRRQKASATLLVPSRKTIVPSAGKSPLYVYATFPA